MSLCEKCKLRSMIADVSLTIRLIAFISLNKNTFDSTKIERLTSNGCENIVIVSFHFMSNALACHESSDHFDI